MLSFAIESTLESFYDHLYGTAGRKYNALEGYIAAWVGDGEAWKACRGDFRLYLAVVATIFASWHDCRESCTDEASWRYPIPWYVKHAFEDGGDPRTEIFDPFYFQCFAPAP
jgi:hypothetical protein